MSIKYINNIEQAPQAIGPYSQATSANGFLFLSGQIAIDPKTLKIVEGGITEQAEQVLKNIAEVLKSQALDFSAVVKATVFLTDLSNFQEVNRIYAKYLADFRPARSTIQVSRLPLDVLLEIEMIAQL